MKKIVLIGVLAVAMASTASAVNLVVNGDWSTGDETGWTQWSAGWSGARTWAVTNAGPTPPEGTLSTSYASYGWFQTIQVPAGETVKLDADWAGNVAAPGWAEVMLWSQAAPGGEAGRADTGAAGDIAFKKDGWGQNPPATWNWQAASLSPANGGNAGTVVSQGYVVVAMKLGTQAGPVNVSFDNITLTPEPAAALLLGLPLLLIRRRRA